MIRVLPPEVINQIAAGEVVERPFSVVKELVENSLDAGAQRLHVTLEEGGRSLIRITDDGCGFSPDDLTLAFASHATSKLSCLDDLEHIASLGFRGEALASIGSIAKTWIRSCPRDAESGHEIRCDGGKIGEVRPTSCPPGSTIEVRDLFFNTPARRRFLKTPRAEKGRIQDMLLRLALARPDVDFTLVVDDKEALRLPGDEDLKTRIGRAFGKQVGDALHPVEQQWDDYSVRGFVGDPDLARRDSSLELLYVNGRLARDKASGYSIRQSYREYLMGGRFPVYFLMLSLPPEQVDVNVHPTKSEVRFLDGRKVCGLLHDSVKQALAGSVIAEFKEPRGASISIGADKPSARSGFPSLGRGLFGSGSSAPPSLPSRVADASPTDDREAAAPAAKPNPFRDLGGRRFVQIANLYLVVEGDDGGMVVIDQHALHERVMYEELLAQYEKDGKAAVQRLLVPDVFDVSPTDKAYLLDAQAALAEEGLLIGDFGGDSIQVEGMPAVLSRIQPRALVESFLHADAEVSRPTATEEIRERFHSRACRSAIMSGDSLTDAEIEALIESAAELEHPHNCPHGRPTVLTFSAYELERFFRRKI